MNASTENPDCLDALDVWRGVSTLLALATHLLTLRLEGRHFWSRFTNCAQRLVALFNQVTNTLMQSRATHAGR